MPNKTPAQERLDRAGSLLADCYAVLHGQTDLDSDDLAGDILRWLSEWRRNGSDAPANPFTGRVLWERGILDAE